MFQLGVQSNGREMSARCLTINEIKFTSSALKDVHSEVPRMKRRSLENYMQDHKERRYLLVRVEVKLPLARR